MLFSGDSLLRNVFNSMCTFAWKTPIDCRGSMHEPPQPRDFSGPGRYLSFHWAPSVYYQQPTHLIPTHDCAVMSMAVWDMGTYSRGVDAYGDALDQNMRAWVGAANRSQFWVGSSKSGWLPKTELFWFRLHSLHPDRCGNQSSMCFLANSPSNQQAHRHIADKLAKRHGIHVIDTHRVTSTREAAADGVVGDAVHFGPKTTRREADEVFRVLRHHGCLRQALPRKAPTSEEARRADAAATPNEWAGFEFDLGNMSAPYRVAHQHTHDRSSTTLAWLAVLAILALGLAASVASLSICTDDKVCCVPSEFQADDNIENDRVSGW